MKKVGIVLVFFVATLGQSNSFGAGPVEVLLIKQNGISLTLSLEVLEQINETLDNSDLFPSHIVIGANGLLGVPEVLITSCSDFDAGDAAECVRDEFESTRNLEDADVVIAVVASLNQCGSTLPGTVNRERIGNENQAYAYAVIRADCLEFPANGMRVASHEFGHILSLEHSDDESGKETTPISYNHAAEDFDDLTVMGNETGLLSGDCPATPCTINDFFSENGRQFPDGGDAGNSSYADAERVVSEISWDVVAAYRPKPPPQPASCGILFLGCHQPLCALWDFSHSAPYATQYRLEAQDWPGGPWSLRTVTSSNHYYPHLGSVGRYWRVRGENAFGVGDWCVYYVPGKCGTNGGGGGGGPIP